MTGLLHSPTRLGDIALANRIVMAPMTRSRAAGNVPGAIMATYYGDRAGAGLIVTEGTSPSPDGLGYARIPGIFSDAQQAGWKAVTDAVHAKGGRIFVQLMHTGRIGHAANLPEGARVIAPSAIAAPGQMWTDTGGMQDHPVPAEMTEADIAKAIGEYAAAAKRAIGG
ncbi:MAG TPA: alkene reductase, partial [Usitatibacteraceae bacterium]|nr:alkene reductase [Usitatibacteraceae bacterium]